MADARIFADLKADHDRHRKLLAQIAETSGASEERKTLFEEFMLEVTAHAAAEEESLYATMLGMPDLRDFFNADVRWMSHYGFRPLDVPTLFGGLSV